MHCLVPQVNLGSTTTAFLDPRNEFTESSRMIAQNRSMATQTQARACSYQLRGPRILICCPRFASTLEGQKAHVMLKARCAPLPKTNSAQEPASILAAHAIKPSNPTLAGSKSLLRTYVPPTSVGAVSRLAGSKSFSGSKPHKPCCCK